MDSDGLDDSLMDEPGDPDGLGDSLDDALTELPDAELTLMLLLADGTDEPLWEPLGVDGALPLTEPGTDPEPLVYGGH
jgi:hypothetical protein